MKRLIPVVLTAIGVTGCFSALTTPPPVPLPSTASSAGPLAPGAVPGPIGPFSPFPLPPASDVEAEPGHATQTFQFEQPLAGAVILRDALVVLRGLPADATFTLTVETGTNRLAAALAPLAPGQMIWQLGDLADGPYNLVAHVRLPNGERGIARTHVRLYRRIGGGGGGGGGGGASGPPAPVTLPPLQPDAWADIPSAGTPLVLPAARAEVGGGVIGDKFVVMGGFGTGSNATGDTFIYDATANAWLAPGSGMVTARTALCSAVADGRIFAIGGLDSIFDPVKAVESYDPLSDTWNQGADLPTARFYATAAALNDQVYVFGGLDELWTEQGATAHYDPVADVWATVAPMPTPRYIACAAPLGDEVIVCGGAQGNTALKVVEAYKPSTNTWRRLPDLPVNVAAGMAVSHGGQLYVFGGYDSAPLVTVWRYDPATNAWALHSVLQRDHIGGVAAAIGTKIYIAGGYNGIDAHDRFQVMTPVL